MDVVVLGDVMLDVVARLTAPIAPGSDAPAEIAFHGGGSGANTAAWLVAAGARPAFVGRVGDDEPGRAAGAALRAAGVDTRLVADPGRPTGTCIVLVSRDGERTMLPDPGANDGLAAATWRTSCSPRGVICMSPAMRCFAPARGQRRSPRSHAPALGR